MEVEDSTSEELEGEWVNHENDEEKPEEHEETPEEDLETPAEDEEMPEESDWEPCCTRSFKVNVEMF